MYFLFDSKRKITTFKGLSIVSGNTLFARSQQSIENGKKKISGADGNANCYIFTKFSFAEHHFCGNRLLLGPVSVNDGPSIQEICYAK